MTSSGIAHERLLGTFLKRGNSGLIKLCLHLQDGVQALILGLTCPCPGDQNLEKPHSVSISNNMVVETRKERSIFGLAVCLFVFKSGLIMSCILETRNVAARMSGRWADNLRPQDSIQDLSFGWRGISTKG